MTHRETVLRAVRFGRPERVPTRINVNASCWNHYETNALNDLMLSHPLIFPKFSAREETQALELEPFARSGTDFLDPWGCRWRTAEDGMTGVVIDHPLSDWLSLIHI